VAPALRPTTLSESSPVVVELAIPSLTSGRAGGLVNLNPEPLTFMSVLLAILLVVTSIFLILLVLIQRGRGGGLAGAFGGLGGQSAFGTKAGDLFTRVTIGAAAVWIVLCVVSVKVMGNKGNLFTSSQTQQTPGGDTSGTGTAAPSKSGESTDKGAADTGSAEKAPAEKGNDSTPPAGTSTEPAPKTDSTDSSK